jgi:hypothetical protein
VALSQLEQGDLSTAAGGSLDRVLRESQTVIDCAGQALPGLASVQAGLILKKTDMLCDVGSVVGAALDPCCNSTLRATTCCASRQYSFVSGSVVSISLSDPVSTCRLSELGGKLFGSFQGLFNQTLNGGCEAQSGDASSFSIDDSLGAVRRCYERVYSVDLLCVVNDDCLSGVCLLGQCVPDATRAVSLLLQCVLSNLPDGTRSLLCIELGLPVSSLDADLEAAFGRRVSRNICEVLPLSGYPFIDSRTTPNVVGVTQTECEAVTPVRCEDGGDLAGCTLRQICVFTWGANSNSYSIFVARNSSFCAPGICSNADVGANCPLVDGCNVIGETTERDCRLSGLCSDVTSIPLGGVCVLPFLSGNRDLCGRSMYRIAMGCVPFSRPSLADCSVMGGQWVMPATSEAVCVASRRCSAALGTAHGVWKWQAGVWGRGSVQIRLAMRAGKIMPIQRWIARVEWAQVSQLWTLLLSKQTGLQFGSYLRCRLVPTLAILKYGLCDCSVLLGRPSSSACWTNGALVLAVRKVAKV